ncbi:MAG: CpsD/CapB family tyrosine-protein kinase [Novosphingobium sp.]
MYAEPDHIVRPAIDGGRPPCAPLDFALSPETLAANMVVGFERMNSRVHPFFVMRSRLLKHARATGQRVFAVTSVQPGDGKTHVSVNLAAALSRIYPTVLVELDLHWPSVSRRLGLPPVRRGIDDFLAGEAGWRETGLKCQASDLTIHPVREHRPDAEDLLASPRLAEFLQDLRSDGSDPICLIDTPPALVNDDLMLIARAVDGVLMVVCEAKTRSPALRETINALNPKPIVGTILNMSISSLRSESDYGSYYNRSE